MTAIRDFRSALDSGRPFVLKCYVLKLSAAVTGGTGNSAVNYTQGCRCLAAMLPTGEGAKETARASGSINPYPANVENMVNS